MAEACNKHNAAFVPSELGCFAFKKVFGQACSLVYKYSNETEMSVPHLPLFFATFAGFN